MNYRKKIVNWQVFGMFGYLLFLVVFASTKERTVIYSTDISLHGDLDDFFDLTAICSINQIDLKIIIDGFELKEQESGLAAVQRFDDICHQKHECMMGSLEKFSEQSKYSDESQILQWLEKSGGGCYVITVGSLRDIAKAYCTNPELFVEKVDRIYVFAADAQGTYIENNVALDEEAFLTIMNSGLNIYWIPCFENGLWTTGRNASYFTVQHEEIFEQEDEKLLKWFIYYYLRGPVEYSQYKVEETDQMKFMSDIRNIWCAPVFTILDGSVYQYLEAFRLIKGEQVEMPFKFVEKQVEFERGGKVTYQKGNVIHCFSVTQREDYESLCKFILKEMKRNIIS